MTADKVRVGVVGLGYWGPNLARNFDRLPGAELAYCCDLDQANLEKAHSLYPTTTVTDDYAQLLADDALDAIVVATSVPTHYKLGKLAIEAGKHTFIEKPIALKAADAADLLTTADSKGLKLMVGHLLLFGRELVEIERGQTRHETVSSSLSLERAADVGSRALVGIVEHAVDDRLAGGLRLVGLGRARAGGRP